MEADVVMLLRRLAHVGAALVLAPLLPGIVNRVKAIAGGRRGQPLLQLYFDLFKLVHKGAVYSTTTTWLFRLGPVAGLVAVMVALTLVPYAGASALVSFPGDFVLMAYVLGMARFFTVLAAMDTGSSFEGMGSSREMLYALLAEPALVVALVAMGRVTHAWSLSGMCHGIAPATAGTVGPVAVLAAGALVLVLLAENCRVPFDDPTTHLELTMIHEVMVLDHGGPDFACIQYAASLKLWLFSALLTAVLVPMPQCAWLGTAMFLGMMACVAVMVGVVESVMARVRLTKVPSLLVTASALALFAFIVQMR